MRCSPAAITVPGDDNNYGSSSMLDVTLLQALSKRIHYGMFVAEAKFRCVGREGRQGGECGTSLYTDAAMSLFAASGRGLRGTPN